MLKAIIFDMDGVLINTEPLHYRMWQGAWRKYGVEIDYDFYKTCIGCTFDYLIEKTMECYHRVLPEGSDIKAETLAIKKEIIKAEGYPMIPGVTELVRDLHESGYILAVASSSALDQIEEALRALEITDYFTAVVSGTMVRHSKPAPDIFVKTAGELAVSPAECVVIEDSMNGVRAAKDAGMRCIGYYNPDSGQQDLSRADVIVDSWEQLKEYIVMIQK